jgi:uncharacterized membrane protein
MRKATITGAVLAATVALLVANAPARADDSSSGVQSQVKCLGGNSCKGQSACKTEASSCAGQNACKGKGWVMSSSDKACTTAGGKPVKD